jgi:hypothetical protein
MNRSKLILMEGLPSTGKSTNSGILLSQLERNGHKARWVHEMARPHPTLFFYEAYLEENEYRDLIARYPQSSLILDKLIVKRGKSIGIDLLEVEWNYREQLEEQTFNDLKQFDVWNFSLERYMNIALEKWTDFVNRQLRLEEIAILDSSIFQFQIFCVLLAEAPFSMLKSFIESLYEIISPLHPSLVYLYRENTDDTIDYLIKDRGIAFLQGIWNRDKHHPYYRDRPSGAEGFKLFLRDYATYAKKLFDSAPFPKLSLEITDGNWGEYVDRLLDFTYLSKIEAPAAHYPNGKYVNEKLKQTIEIIDDQFLTPNGGRKRLLPKSDTEFYLNDIPTVIRVEGNAIVMEGEQVCERWTTKGTVFTKV